ncbi:MAG: sulfite exporter TauE/SafE family protein [Gammaproteobacteria bacterium]|nr:sulfite exporter TauE/SafE family protein [Gammaproteobacteria bacterium]
MISEFGYLLAFLTGLTGAFHCLGMCGGFAAGYFAGHGWRDRLWPQLGYHGMRIASYVLLGVAGALAGRVLVQVGMVGKTQGLVMILSGLLICAIGLRYLLRGGACATRSTNASAQRPIRFDQHPRSRYSMPLLAGLLNGFVPCSLLFSVALKTVAAQPLQAGALMLCFGLGTLPMTLSVTLMGALGGHFTRGSWNLLTGILVLAFGGWTLYEGWYFFDIMRGLAG